uniref:Si:dkey-16j16.4 n=1 Tax=Gasterosteus aculeatus aculeatus TaxID=481459 RepID=A0AAQ4PXI4_GASAC
LVNTTVFEEVDFEVRGLTRQKISYHGRGEGGESDDSEGENQELAQIDRERWRNCCLTPLATSQQHNQGLLSPARLRRLRLLLDANVDRHSSEEEELERISRGDNRKWLSALPRRHGDHHSSPSSDEEVRDLCGCRSPSASARALGEPAGRLAASPSPVLFSSSPPRSVKPPPMRFQLQVVQPVARPIILTHFDQSAPYRKYRHSYGGEPGRPSLDLEKMQQKMLLKKNCGGKTRTIKIRNVTGGRPPPRYTYDPSIFAFRSLSVVPPCSPLAPSEDPPCS